MAGDLLFTKRTWLPCLSCMRLVRRLCTSSEINTTRRQDAVVVNGGVSEGAHLAIMMATYHFQWP